MFRSVGISTVTGWVVVLFGALSMTQLTAASRKSYSGLFGKTAFINSDDVTHAITEGEVLAITYAAALKDEELFPWEGAIYSSLIFGQAGKSKFSLVPRLQRTWLGDDFKPFTFSIGAGAGATFLFLRTNNYGGLLGQVILATDINLGEGVSIGGESTIELPFSNETENPPNLSVLFRVTYRDG